MNPPAGWWWDSDDQIFSVCRSHITVRLSSVMTYHRICMRVSRLLPLVLGEIRSRQSNKYRQHNGLSKKGKNTNNVPQTLHVQSKLKIEKHELVMSGI
jgi:hypothetical protein